MEESENRESITIERLAGELYKTCSNTLCSDCKYLIAQRFFAFFTWLLEHYNITEKEKETENE